MEIINVKTNDLRGAEYNPRAMTDLEASDLRESLNNFGLVEPIIVNKNPERMNVIVGGHQRYFILKQMGEETVPVVYVDLNLEAERELNLRLNKNSGHWDWSMLANFEEEMLKKVGFLEDELAKVKSTNIDSLIETQDVDIARMDVIVVDGPNAPKLKNRKGFYFDTIEQFNEVVKFFETKTDYKLDGARLLQLLKK